MANEKRLISVSDENIKAVLEKVPYYPDEIWKFTAMTKRFPTVDAVEVVHGRWIETEEGTICSECNKHPFEDGEYAISNYKANYCPNCGARMDVGVENGC